MAAQHTLLELESPARRSRQSSRPFALDEAAKAQIYRQWRRGVSVEVLAQQNGRSSAAIMRAINEVRAVRILEQKLEFMYNPSFDESTAATTILGPMPASGKAQSASRAKAPEGLPPYLASLYGEGGLPLPQDELFEVSRQQAPRSGRSRAGQGVDP
jgi:hypothetical protein